MTYVIQKHYTKQTYSKYVFFVQVEIETLQNDVGQLVGVAFTLVEIVWQISMVNLSSIYAGDAVHVLLLYYSLLVFYYSIISFE